MAVLMSIACRYPGSELGLDCGRSNSKLLAWCGATVDGAAGCALGFSVASLPSRRWNDIQLGSSCPCSREKRPTLLRRETEE
jgi:hypothetical protein